MTMKTTGALIAAPILFALAQGCSMFGSSNDDAKNNVVGAGGTATGGTSATGGGGTTAGTGGGSLGGSGGSSLATCPVLLGPQLVMLHAPNGTPYCIDRTEVTQADYAVFLKQTTSKPGTEDARCQAENYSYEPLNNPPDPIEPKICTSSFNPTTTPNHPVVCVDWCDAQAYCKWAGKRLCGKIGGGPGTVSAKIEDPNDPANSATASEWYNACSQGGETRYVYGDSYDPNACRGPETKKDAGASTKIADVGSAPNCRGASAPYSSILDMNGSVMELTDECASANGYVCAARGGGVNSASSPSCALYSTVNLGQHFEDMGFRCCTDPN